MQLPSPVANDNSLPTPSTSATSTFMNVSTAFQVNGVQVLGARRTGWTAQTTAQTRGDMGGAPVLATVASTLAALIADLTAHGAIGP